MLDEAGNLREFCRLFHLFIRCIGAAIADVIGYRIVEQDSILRHHADGLAQAFLRDITDILPVDGNRSGLHIVEAEQKPRDRGFARTRRPDNRDRLSCRNFKTDPLEDRPVRIIGEMHVFKADRALVDLQCWRTGFVDDFLLHIEKIEHLLDIGEALTDFTIDKADEVERNGQLHQHGIDENEVADGLRSGADFQRGHDHDNCHADTEDHGLAEVQPAERCPGLGRRLFITRHRSIEALGFHVLIAEIFDRFEIEKRVDCLGVGLRIGIVHFPADADAPVARLDRKPGIEPDRCGNDELIGTAETAGACARRSYRPAGALRIDRRSQTRRREAG